MPVNSLRHYLLLMAMATIWSSSFAVIKVGLETLPPATLAAGRIVLAALLLYGFMRFRGGRLPPLGPVWGTYFAVGLFGNGLPFLLINWGEQLIDSGLAAILMAVMPLATLILTHFYTTDERMSLPKVLGVLAGFSGVAVLMGADALAGMSGHVLAQVAVAGGAVCYAVATTMARHLPHRPTEERSAAVMLASMVLIVPASLIMDQPWALDPSADSVAACIYLGLFPTALATILYFILISERGATFISFNNYIIPVLGVLWGVLFLDEVLTVRSVLALLLVLSGIFLATYRSRGWQKT